ncbi:MAG: FAD-dependent oxidoreductase [bacterium]|nr:FAD-dependent oxidoreductase [bacterium]
MKKIIAGLIVFFILLSVTNGHILAQTQTDYDVIVVGAGTGGVSAAIQAARLGARVLLLEETDWLGGQMTAAGVSTMDGSPETAESGIYQEFITRVKSYYQAKGRSLSTCYWSGTSTCFEPSVGREILQKMIDDTKNLTLQNGTKAVLDVGFKKHVVNLVKGGTTIQGVVTKEGETFNGKIVIDATEYGDLIPLTDAQYRIGNLIAQGTNVSGNACIQDITYTAIVKNYLAGVPSELVMDAPIGNYSPHKTEFEGTLSLAGSIWFVKTGYPFNWVTYKAYRGVPDLSPNAINYNASSAQEAEQITKTGLNWANDYPSTSVLSTRYLSDVSYRKQMNCAAKIKTLNLLYYIQHDMGQPSWSVADDQGYAQSSTDDNLCNKGTVPDEFVIPDKYKTIEKNLPVIPYVRESRRIIGLHTLTGREIKRVGTPLVAQTTFTSSLAVGDYPDDLHNCKTDDTLEKDLESTSDVPTGFVSGAFQIPFESFIPQTVDGFLVAEKNLSQSRLVNGASRLQPITMLTGQAAGAIAGVSVRLHTQPRNVDILSVQKELLLAGDPLSIRSLGNRYVDVPKSDSRWMAVQMISLYQILTDVGNSFFASGGTTVTISRAEAAVVLARIFHLSSSATLSDFSDVSPQDPSFAAIKAIYKAGMTSGCGINPLRFCPTAPIARADLVVMVNRGLKLNSQTGSCPKKSQGDFNCDGNITLLDFNEWRNQFKGKPPINGVVADTNGDGKATLTDFNAWRTEFKKRDL